MAKNVPKKAKPDKVDTYTDTSDTSNRAREYLNIGTEVMKYLFPILNHPELINIDHSTEDIEICVSYYRDLVLKNKDTLDLETKVAIVMHEESQLIPLLLYSKVYIHRLTKNKNLIFDPRYKKLLEFYSKISKNRQGKVKKHVDTILDDIGLSFFKYSKQGKPFSFDNTIFNILFEDNPYNYKKYVDENCEIIKKFMSEKKIGKILIHNEAIKYAYEQIYKSKLRFLPDINEDIRSVRHIAIYFDHINFVIPFKHLRNLYKKAKTGT